MFHFVLDDPRAAERPRAGRPARPLQRKDLLRHRSARAPRGRRVGRDRPGRAALPVRPQRDRRAARLLPEPEEGRLGAGGAEEHGRLERDGAAPARVAAGRRRAAATSAAPSARARARATPPHTASSRSGSCSPRSRAERPPDSCGTGRSRARRDSGRRRGRLGGDPPGPAAHHVAPAERADPVPAAPAADPVASLRADDHVGVRRATGAASLGRHERRRAPAAVRHGERRRRRYRRRRAVRGRRADEPQHLVLDQRGDVDAPAGVLAERARPADAQPSERSPVAAGSAGTSERIGPTHSSANR